MDRIQRKQHWPLTSAVDPSEFTLEDPDIPLLILEFTEIASDARIDLSRPSLRDPGTCREKRPDVALLSRLLSEPADSRAKPSWCMGRRPAESSEPSLRWGSRKDRSSRPGSCSASEQRRFLRSCYSRRSRRRMDCRHADGSIPCWRSVQRMRGRRWSTSSEDPWFGDRESGGELDIERTPDLTRCGLWRTEV